MARATNASQIWRSLTSIDMYEQLNSGTFGSTTTAEAIVAGVSDVDITASTNFTTGDPVFIEGSGGLERSQITGTLATTPCLLLRDLQVPQDSGATFIEAVKKPLGYIEQAGASLSLNKAIEDVFAANAVNAVASIEGTGTMEVSFSLLDLAPENFQLIFGHADTVVGAGTATDPTTALVGYAHIAASPRRIFTLTGLLQGGKTIEVDLIDAIMGVSGGPTFGKTTANIPVTAKFATMAIRQWS